MNDEVRSLASLLAADLTEWGVGAKGVDPETGECLEENSLLSRWCEWVPKVVLSAVWPDGAAKVDIYAGFMERVEEDRGWPLHCCDYEYEAVFGEGGVSHLAVVGELWDRRKLTWFVRWALEELYPQFEAITGKKHACEGRVAVLEHMLGTAAQRAA